MIVSLTIENVRGQSITHHFQRANLLKGRNGAGKSTVREALCYAFAGTDSGGSRSPSHLISRGSDSLRVEVKTERSLLTRTLTRTGSQTIGLTVGGVRLTLSQTELSQKLGCGPDVFLSVLNPGYFMRLPVARQQAVLAEILPAVDRKALLTELSEVPLSPDDVVWSLIDLTKRGDLAGTKLTQQRRLWQSQLDQARGRLTVHAAVGAPVPEPTLPFDLEARLKVIGQLGDAWKDYGHRRAAATKASIQRDQAVSQNMAIVAERAALERELAAPAVPEPAQADSPAIAIVDLQSKLRQPRTRPDLQSIPGEPRCSACGQMVGSKHKEKVAADNAKLVAAWEAECAEVERHNAAVRAQIAEVEARYKAERRRYETEAKTYEADRRRRLELQAKLSALREVPLPELPPEPTQPTEPYDGEEEIRLRETWRNHQLALGAHRADVERRARAAAAGGELEREIASLGEAVARAERLEDALRRLPQEELARQTAALGMRGYRLETGDQIGLVREDGAPYASLSTGERVKGDVALSMKINALLRENRRPAPGVIFLDDSDLVDDLPAIMDMPGMQVFVAMVVPKLAVLEVSHG